jgi:hypothetical protein
MPRRGLINLILVEEKIIESSGSYEPDAIEEILAEEEKMPTEV